MQLIGIDDLRRIQLEILDTVDAFCQENSIRYSLCGGTMLGAVRHKGYIPWDDDIDLMMLRTDYDRFLLSFRAAGFHLMDLSRMDNCTEQFCKICKDGTCMVDVRFGRSLWGVNIDIFPIDGLPADFKPYTDTLRATHNIIMDTCPYYKGMDAGKMKWFLKYCIKRLIHPTFRSVRTMKDWLNSQARAHLPEESPLSTVVFGDYIIYPFRSDLFFQYERIPFEGKEYSCIRNRNLYLSTVYGDYMQLPPEEKRITHHTYDAFLL